MRSRNARQARRSPRRAQTLVETLIAVGLLGLLVAGVFGLLVGGGKLYRGGVEAARGPEAAILLFERLERDLIQVLQAPGDPRPPVRIDDEGGVAFYLPDPGLSGPDTVVAGPCWWGLVEDPSRPGVHHPVRNGEVLVLVDVGSWEFELVEPDLDAGVFAWTLRVEARFPLEAGRPDHVVLRRFTLAQPTSNYLDYPWFGWELLPENVALLPPPEGDPRFQGLGPPDELMGMEGP